MVSTATAQLDLPHSAWLEIFSRVVKKMKAKHAEFWGAKVIYSTIRVVVPGSEEVDGIRWALRDCIKLKQEFPEVICGSSLILLLLDSQMLTGNRIRSRRMGGRTSSANRLRRGPPLVPNRVHSSRRRDPLHLSRGGNEW